MKYFLGIDNGGTTSRAVLYDSDGKAISYGFGATKMLSEKEGFTERDMDEFWFVTADCVREAIEKSGINPSDIACVTCCGHGKGLYVLDKDKKPFRNGIISTDTRAYAYIERWKGDGTAERVYKKTFQSVLVSQPCAILRWLKDNEPKQYEKIGCVFGAKDYIRFCLTGNVSAEYTDMSGTNLLNLETRQYDDELLREFGIEEIKSALPKIVDSLIICGGVTKQAAQMTGLREGTPVSGGMFDIDACALASGVINEENLCVIAGTWSINEYVSKNPVKDKSISMNSIFCMPEFYLIEESSPTSAGNLAWLVNNVFSTDKALAKNDGKSVYAEFDKLAENADPEKRLFYLPYVFGSQNNPRAKGIFAGLGADTAKGEIVRAVLEGVVFNHRMHVEKLLNARKGNPPRLIRLAGGSARSKLWVQVFADILKLPVQTIDSEELGALGCAINGSVAAGVYKDLKAAAEKMVKVGEIITPRENFSKLYDEKYELFKLLESRMNDFWNVL